MLPRDIVMLAAAADDPAWPSALSADLLGGLPDGVGGSLAVAVGAIALVLLLSINMTRFTRRRETAGGAAVLSPPPVSATGSAPCTPGTNGLDTMARRMCSAFRGWLADCDDGTDLWTGFDQLARELLTEHLGASRVRCYHVEPGGEALQAISQLGRTAEGSLSARAGLLGHVATSGSEFVTGNPAGGPLVEDLAAQDDQRWMWVWPVRNGRASIGIIAVGNLRDPAALTNDVRQAVGQLISLFWQHVACVEQLRVVQRTDQASGVLTRNDFFTLAGHALADSYGGREPVVVTVLALEGLRRLDDGGRWRERDALIERIGNALARRIRSDDLVGRFADDRFVVFLRRLDSGLGQLIAEKMLAAAQECVTPLGPASEAIRTRIGLAGSGFAQPPLDTLLVNAFDAVDRARRDGLPIVSDLKRQQPEAPTQ